MLKKNLNYFEHLFLYNGLNGTVEKCKRGNKTEKIDDLEKKSQHKIIIICHGL